jgi:site-specific recombinase XerD
MNTTSSILFYIKRSKANVDGICPIYVRVTILTRRFEFSSNKYIDPKRWSQEGSNVKGTNEDSRSINNHLDNIKSKIFDAEKRLYKKDIVLTSINLKNELFGITENKRMLIPIFKDHNNKIKELIGNEYAPGTLERYNTSLKHTINFLEWKYKISDIEIYKIDHAFITEYEFYLRSVRKCCNNTAVKYIKNFNKIIKLCLANDWLDKNPFANYKSKVKEVERVYLSEGEIQNIINKDFKNDRLSLVRDIFLFSCFTGLAYIDVKQLTLDNISLGIDGDKWIFKNRQKTDTASKIPLLPMAQEIIDKYTEHPVCKNEKRLLPILTNQKMNAYLKEIADVCGIKKDLTFHIARHTFATTITLSNGVPLETVSKMLGHTSLKTTQHYAKILDKKISEDMMILKSKFKKSSVISVQNDNREIG